MASPESQQNHDIKIKMNFREKNILRIAAAKATCNIGAFLYIQNQSERAVEYCNISAEYALHACEKPTVEESTEQHGIDHNQLRNILQFEEHMRNNITDLPSPLATGQTKIDHPSQFNTSKHGSLVLGMHFFNKPLVFELYSSLASPHAFFMDKNDFLPTSMFFNLALNYHRDNKLDLAREFFEMSIENFDSSETGYNDTLIKVLVHSNIGHLHFRKGQYQKAADHFMTALVKLRSNDKSFRNFFWCDQGSQFRHCLKATLLNLANTYVLVEEYDKAADLCKDALYISMQEKKRTDSDFDVSVTQHIIGIIHHKRGYNEKALQCYNAYFQYAQANLGSYHPYVATTMHNMGQVLFDELNYQGATEMFLQSLKIRQNIYGDFHKDIVKSLYSIGRTLHEREEYTDAMRAYQRVLHIQKTLFGEMHLDVVSTMCNIARIYQIMGRLEESLVVNENVLQIAQHIFQCDHPFLATILNALGSILIEMDMIDKAMEALKEANRIKDTTSGINCPLAGFCRQYPAASAA